MKNLFIIIITSFLLTSCSTRSQLIYLKDSDHNNLYKVDYSNLNNKIEIGDILKIDIKTIVAEAAIPYNTSNLNSISSTNLDLLKIDGYIVDESMIINYPILGEISVKDLSLNQLEKKISELLLNGGHLTNHTVKIKRLNSKFTVLGEVKNPGTFSNIDEKLNILQALGYAGDLTILGKRKDIIIIREKNGLRKIYKVDLTNTDFLSKANYQIKNNDIIIVNPNYSKVKSAGFIGSPASIASISSLFLSLTLLLINNN